MRRKNALIRFCFNKDPKKLSDDEWCELYYDAEFVLKYTGAIVEKNG